MNSYLRMVQSSHARLTSWLLDTVIGEPYWWWSHFSLLTSEYTTFTAPQQASTLAQGGHKIGQKFNEFSRLLHNHNYTFPEFIATQSIHNNYLHIYEFSGHLLGRVVTLWDHNDPVYPVNSCFTQMFNRTTTILYVIIFPWGCTEFHENSVSFPCSTKSLSIQGYPDLWSHCSIPRNSLNQATKYTCNSNISSQEQMKSCVLVKHKACVLPSILGDNIQF